MTNKKTIQLYDKKEKQGSYYYQLNGKSIMENYIEIMKERQQKYKKEKELEKELEKQIEKIIDKVLSETLNIK